MPSHFNRDTEIRRTLQPLWNAFQCVLSPYHQEGIVLAVSGGIDSRALLEAIGQWPERTKGRYQVVCVDHGMRPESSQEAQVVVARAKTLGFIAHSIRLELAPNSNEAVMRQERYNALWEWAQKRQLRAIVTAHQADDEAEGFLMDLLGLGGGEHGASMGNITSCEQGNLLRPLLAFSRLQLHHVLTALEVDNFVVDPTNLAGFGQRTWVRQHVLPLLGVLKPNIKARLAGKAKEQSELLQLLEEALGEKISVQILPDRVVRLSFDLNLKSAWIKLALKKELKALCPDLDLRNAKPTLLAIGAWYEKTARQNRLPLDPKDNSITLSEHSARFCFPGAVAFAGPGFVHLALNTNAEKPVQKLDFCYTVGSSLPTQGSVE